MRLGPLRILEYIEQHLRPRAAGAAEPRATESRPVILGVEQEVRHLPSKRTVRIVNPYRRQTSL